MLKTIMKKWGLSPEEFARITRIANIQEKLDGKSYLEGFQYLMLDKVGTTAEKLMGDEEFPITLMLLEESGKLDRREMSKFTGVSRDTINRWISGEARPSKTSAWKVSAYLYEGDSDQEFKYELIRFLRLRKETGVGQAAVEDCLNISLITLNKWAGPNYQPNKDNLEYFLPWMRDFNDAAEKLVKTLDNGPEKIGKSHMGRRRQKK